MFDDHSFSDVSFERQAWMLSALATVRREVVRLVSVIRRTVTLRSEI